MNYFSEYSAQLRLRAASQKQVGLRAPQLGAICSTVAHFTIRHDPAVIVMPTGSGKSLVLMALCYALSAKRVLILTPSKLLRDQIFEDFRKLESVHRYELLPKTSAPPNVFEVKKRLASKAEWKKLSAFDVAVGTPNCISPRAKGVQEPPSNLFDLILIDEAHHSPAKTWTGVLESFPDAKKVLVTATPFRSDRKEIKGTFTYVFPLRKAFEQQIFGNILFVPVTDAVEGEDYKIAATAESTLRKDRSVGLNHYLIVRTDSRSKADELLKVYSKHTKLKLRVVHSGHGFKTIKSTINQLKNGELDGVIAVAMLGEGFDFPNLKIAAIHSPHRSLPITLQFIGRFARTGGDNLGDAKFIAIPSEIKVESEKLYREDASWQEIITNLVETQIESEVRIKRGLESFKAKPELDDEIDISLYTLKPFCHVKIYRTADVVDLKTDITQIQGKEVVADGYSEELDVRYLLCRETLVPRWTNSNTLAQISYDLHVLYFDTRSNLLFINSTDRSFALYEEIAKLFCPSGHHILSLVEINRVVRNLKNPQFSNIGMKSAVRGTKTESYRIIAGQNAQATLSQADGYLFHRGHVFGKGASESGDVGLGPEVRKKLM